MYKLYAIDNYARTKIIMKECVEYELDDLIEELQKNRGYHMRIDKDGNYIFFGDLDHYKGDYESFSDLLMNFLKKYYDIQVSLRDISYTKNEGKDGSFHYSIPKYNASCAKIKEIHQNFLDKYPDRLSETSINKKGKETITRFVDTTIYTDKWFRYPLQDKAGAK